MGAISAVIDSFDKSDKELENIKDQLAILSDLARSRADFAEATITRSLEEGKEGRGLLLPITRVIDTSKETHAMASNGIGGIKKTIRKSINGFLKGGSENIVGGIIDIVAQGLTAFLGAGSGSDDQYAKYFIVNDGPLSLVRFDVWGWKREAVGSGIKEKVESVSAFVGFKSIIDFNKLSFPDFINLYQTQLMNSGMPRDNMIEALKQAREVYDVMVGPDAGKVKLLESELDLGKAPLAAFRSGFESGFSNLEFEAVPAK